MSQCRGRVPAAKAESHKYKTIEYDILFPSVACTIARSSAGKVNMKAITHIDLKVPQPHHEGMATGPNSSLPPSLAHHAASRKTFYLSAFLQRKSYRDVR